MTKMKFCANCGTKLEENARFCGNCGEKIDVEESLVSDNVADQSVMSEEIAVGAETAEPMVDGAEESVAVDAVVVDDALHYEYVDSEEVPADTPEAIAAFHEEPEVSHAAQTDSNVVPLQQQDTEDYVVTHDQVKPKGLLAQKRALFGGIGGAVVLLVGFFGWQHFSNEYSYDNAVVAFAQAYQAQDDATLSQLLSTAKDKWTPERAKSFRESLTSNQVDVIGKLKGLVEQRVKNSSVNGIYFDEVAKERILQVDVTEKFLGVIPVHKVVVDKVKVFAKNDYVEELEVVLNGKSTKVAKNNTEIEIGQVDFGQTKVTLKGKIDQKEFEREQTIDTATVKQNKHVLMIQSVKNSINATLPDVVKEHAKDVVYKVNGQDVKDVTGLIGDAIELVAVFKVGDKTIETQPAKVTISAQGQVSPSFELKAEDVAAVTDAVAAVKKAEADKRDFENEKSAIETFVRDYRDDIFRGITNRTTTTFSRYYDSENNPVYRQYRDYVMNDVPRLKIDSYRSNHFKILDVRKEGEEYVVETDSDFTVHYIDGGKKPTQKRQTYRLKKSGNSYVIVSVTPL